MKNLRNSEMLRFENWLWEHYNPAEVFEDWAERTTEAIIRLAEVANLRPTDITLSLSEDSIFRPIYYLHEYVRTPLEERDENDMCKEFYSGVALTEEELRWVTLHIQSAIIPAV